MTSRSPSTELERVLEESQRLGFLGERPIPEVIDHARTFVVPLEGVTGTVIDLGSGGGVPGLVIAHDRPDLAVVLADRRTKRTDFLRRVVSRLGWTDRVSVVTDDVERLIVRMPNHFDAVVARGFGPPESTLRMASELLDPTGVIVISEPPSGDRWRPDHVADLGLFRLDDGSGPVSVFSADVPRETSSPAST
ncbi:RsmG family class I SAM-dependent methyltransferase [Ilumatobacter nonamiensis]|uniref:RsmG family class I SAM-dependent methyltransferase n=1 Tax=Ilumatobacter nonamiensis TaxID=467093 RepID=UPI0006853985|nr:RsmG family class I SAM-dependent methyltransferase [Ilumatobacter nonamiensis]